MLRLARKYAADGGRALDVGSRDCQYITWFDWFTEKYTLDLESSPELAEVTAITADFMTYTPQKHFDLVLCLQVLEHLADPHPFCQKLLSTGRIVIVSVPYMWPKGMCRYHKQDPVDVSNLLEWAGKPWIEHTIVTDGNYDRLVAAFAGNGATK